MVVQRILLLLLPDIVQHVAGLRLVSELPYPRRDILQCPVYLPPPLVPRVAVHKAVHHPTHLGVAEPGDLADVVAPHGVTDAAYVGPACLGSVHVGEEHVVAVDIGAHLCELGGGELGEGDVAVGLARAQEGLPQHGVGGEGHGGDGVARLGEPARAAQQVDDRAVVLHAGRDPPHGAEHAEAVVDEPRVGAPAEHGEVGDRVGLERARHFVEHPQRVEAAAVRGEGEQDGVVGDDGAIGVADGAEDGDGAVEGAALGVHVDEGVADADAGVEAAGAREAVDGGALGEVAEQGAGGEGGDDGDVVGGLARGEGGEGGAEAAEEGEGEAGVGAEGEAGEEGVPGGDVAEGHFVEHAAGAGEVAGLGVGVEEGGDEEGVRGEAEAEEEGVELERGGERGGAGAGLEGERKRERVGARRSWGRMGEEEAGEEGEGGEGVGGGGEGAEEGVEVVGGGAVVGAEGAEGEEGVREGGAGRGEGAELKEAGAEGRPGVEDARRQQVRLQLLDVSQRAAPLYHLLQVQVRHRIGIRKRNSAANVFDLCSIYCPRQTEPFI